MKTKRNSQPVLKDERTGRPSYPMDMESEKSKSNLKVLVYVTK